MSRGCPVIAADATALPEVVGDGGLLVAPDDVQGWTDAMNRLLEDEELGRQLADKGRARARQFDWPTAAARLEDVYRSVLAERTVS
jgi:glycosyltransferase involved in cell wall biosynthesis